MILAFAHPALVVPDLEAAREFYQQMFGFRMHSQEGWKDNPVVDSAIGSRASSCRGYTLAGHNCYLELFEFEAPPATGPEPGSLGPQEPGIRHLAFYVDDCRAECERFLSLGGSALGQAPPPESGINVVYMRDPFGNIIELCEIPTAEENPLNLPGITRLNNQE